MEAILQPVPSWDAFPEDFKEIFQAFRTDAVGWDLIVNKNIFVEKVLPSGIVRGLTEEEMNIYRVRTQRHGCGSRFGVGRTKFRLRVNRRT